MVGGKLMDRPVQLRYDRSEDEDLDLNQESESNTEYLQDGFGSDQDSNTSRSEKESESSSSEKSDLESANFKDISFGALARAQESLASIPEKSRKRKFENDEEDLYTTNQEDSKAWHEKPAPKQVSHRSSKHAPSAQSSRYAVSRKREIFAPSPALKSRDPRFDPTIASAPSESRQNANDKANKQYSFLSEYQQSEIATLKGQIQKVKTKDPNLAEQLKRQMMSLESKLRSAETRNREREIRKRHQQTERQAIRAGKKAKAFYLKDGEVKKLVREEMMGEMRKGARDKLEERRQKREKTKQARHMPWKRRSKVE